MNGADVAAFGDDGVGGEPAHLELRALGIFLFCGLIVADRGVLVARQNWTAFFLSAVGRADLHKVGLGGYCLFNVRRKFGIETAGISAPVTLLSQVVAEKQLVVAGALRAVSATARRGYKLRVALIERRVFQDEQ